MGRATLHRPGTLQAAKDAVNSPTTLSRLRCLRIGAQLLLPQELTHQRTGTWDNLSGVADAEVCRLAGHEDLPNARRYFSTTRLEAFSDGVFAIAITLLVLDLALRPNGSPLERVVHAWPSFLAYVISFLTIGAAWLGHTALTDRLTRADMILLRLNLLLLLVISFLPFPTRLVSEALDDIEGERVFVTMYGLTLLCIRVLGFALDEYARREHLYSDASESEESERDRRTILPVVVGYAIAILLGLVLPRVAVAAYSLIAIYLFVPFREVTQLLFRRE
jgi:uncharacterized membrane protein